MSLLAVIKNALSGEKQISSSESARQRLHILLINDRAGFPNPDFIPQLRMDIIEVLRKYIPIVNNDAVEINYTDDAHILEMSVSLDPGIDSDEPKESKEPKK